MAEYIDKHAMLNMIRPDDSGDERAAVTISDVKRLMRTLINSSQVVDAVPVLRCEYCKYFHPHVDYYSGKTYNYGFCDYWEKETLGDSARVNGNDFCSHGKRKD